MTGKIFRTLDEQIEIFKKRGLIVKDEVKARNILFKENYFFISGYRHLFTVPGDKDKYREGTTFEELYATFIFDRRIRNIFFKNILIVENNIKSIMSYQLSKKYGFKEKDYLEPKNFTNDSMKSRQVYDVLSKVKRQIRINGNKHTATYHYMNNYGFIPLWILVKVLSFGIMAEFYDILKYEDKKDISSVYNLDVDILKVYLTLLSNFRNVCAHEDILYDHRTQKVIPDCFYHKALDIPENLDGYMYGKNDLFSLVIMLKYMLDKDEFNLMVDEIKKEVDLLDEAIDVVPLESILSKIGFPSNWKDIKEVEDKL